MQKGGDNGMKKKTNSRVENLTKRIFETFWYLHDDAILGAISHPFERE